MLSSAERFKPEYFVQLLLTGKKKSVSPPLNYTSMIVNIQNTSHKLRKVYFEYFQCFDEKIRVRLVATAVVRQ